MRKGVLAIVVVAIGGSLLLTRKTSNSSKNLEDSINELEEAIEEKNKLVFPEAILKIDEEFLISTFPNTNKQVIKFFLSKFQRLLEVTKPKFREEVERSFRNILISYRDLVAAETDSQVKLSEEFFEFSSEHFQQALEKSSPKVKANGAVVINYFITIADLDEKARK